jgi:hypothetical protein
MAALHIKQQRGDAGIKRHLEREREMKKLVWLLVVSLAALLASGALAQYTVGSRSFYRASSGGASVAFGVAGGNAYCDGCASNQLSFNLSGITSGTNLVGVVDVGASCSGSGCQPFTMTVSWGGDSMTAAGTAGCESYFSSYGTCVQQFVLPNPPTGTPTILVTTSATAFSITADGWTANNVNQTTPVRSGSWGCNTTSSASMVLAVPGSVGDLTTTAAGDYGDVYSTNQTLIMNNESAHLGLASDYASLASGSSVTHTWSTANQGSLLCGFSLEHS